MKLARFLRARCYCSTGSIDACGKGIEFVRTTLEKLQDSQGTESWAYATLLKECTRLKAVAEGRLVHGQIKHQGLGGNPYLCNWLVQLYGTNGCLLEANAAFESNVKRNEYTWTIMLGAYAQNEHLSEAASLFQKMPYRNVVSWNSMIAAYAQKGESRKAMLVYNRMNVEGIEANEFTLLGVMDACICPELLEEGRNAHDRAIQSGFMANPKVRNAVINMYGKCARVEDARRAFETMQDLNSISWNTMVAVYGQNDRLEEAKEAFDKMPAWGVISWNTMLAAYGQNGQFREGIQLFQDMEARGFDANEVTFLTALDICANDSFLAEGRNIHFRLVHRNLHRDAMLATLLVNMYGKCGCPEEARAVFDTTKQRSVILWNSMLTAYTQNGCNKQALELFRVMDMEGWKMDTITLIIVLDGCNLKEARVIYDSIRFDEVEDEVVVRTACLNTFGKCNGLEDAMGEFLDMPSRNVVSWNAIISVMVANGRDPEQAFHLFRKMDMEGFQATVVTIVTILDGCASLPAKFGKQVHDAIRESPLYFDVFVGSSLINFHGKCKSPDDAKILFDELRGWRNVVSFTALLSAFYQNSRLQDARDVFEKMPERSLISWNAILSAYAQAGDNDEATRLFRGMLEQGMEPDYGSFASILESCHSLPLELVKFVHSTATYSGYHEYESVLSVLVKAYVRCASLPDAFQAFDRLPRDRATSWNVLIGAFVQAGYIREALGLFKSMDLEGVQPGNMIFLSVVDACAQLGNKAVSEAREIHSAIRSCQSLESDVLLCNALVNMYAKCGCPDEARAVFEGMQSRTIVSWTSIIMAYGAAGHSRDALEIFRMMNLDGMEPDFVTFVCLLSSLSHAGEINRCLDSFLDMQTDFGMEPGIFHFVCILDLLGRAGKLDLAEELVQSMPLEPHSVAWMTLLSACKIHGNDVSHADVVLYSLSRAENSSYV